MKTLIYRTRKVIDDKQGNEFLVTQDNLDCELSFDEVYVISDIVHEWVAAKSVADLDNGKYDKIRNNSFRGLLSNMALHSPVVHQPNTYFIEKEVDHG